MKEAVDPVKGRQGPEEPDLERLEKFISIDEKSHTLFYAGRERLIQRIVQSAYRAAEQVDEQGKAKGVTWLLHGAPGAGKTALMEEVGRNPRTRNIPNAPTDEEWKRNKPLLVALDQENLNLGESKLVEVILDRVTETAEAREHFRTVREQGGTFAVGNGGFVSWSGRRKTVTLPPDATLTALKNLIEEISDRPLILTIDEIQDVSSKAASVLGQLHSGNHSMRILPVCGGLSNSRNVLENLLRQEGGRSESGGLTRIAAERSIQLGRLEEGEARQAVERMLTECRIRNWQGSDIPGMLAHNTEGWPQHLHNGMRALASMLVRCKGDFSKISREELERQEEKMRQDSHLNRKTDQMKDSFVYVARVMHAVTRSRMNRGELAVEMRKISEAGRDESERLPEGISATRFLTDHLMRKGALQEERTAVNAGTEAERTEDVFGSPIPCFAAHLIAAGGPGGTTDVLEANAEPERELAARIPATDSELVRVLRSGFGEARDRLVGQVDGFWEKGTDILNDPSARTGNGETLLHRLARIAAESKEGGKGDIRGVATALLAELSRDSDTLPKRSTAALVSPDKDGDTPIHVLCRNAMEQELSRVLEFRSAQTDFSSLLRHPDMRTPLHDLAACAPAGPCAIKNAVALSAKSIDRERLLHATDGNGDTALHLAAANPHGRKMCEHLLEQGADVRATNESGQTPLHKAAMNLQGFLTCRMLIERGADVEARDVRGMTPRDIAAEHGLHGAIPEQQPSRHGEPGMGENPPTTGMQRA